MNKDRIVVRCILLVCVAAFFLPCSLPCVSGEPSVDQDHELELRFVNSEEFAPKEEHSAIVSFGAGGHWIKKGKAAGLHLSGIAPATDSILGVYGRGELIYDEYKTGRFWSWNMAIGGSFSVLSWFIPFVTIGKCFSNYSTCYFNYRHPTANDDDIDAIYYGLGSYFQGPVPDGMLEVAVDWSPYKGYRGCSLYIGYGFKF